MRQIIAMGGGGFSMEPENLALDRYVLQQTHKADPRVCFLPTASGDSDSYILNFYKSFSTLPCHTNYLSVFRPPTADLEGFIMEQDVIYVGGGSTRSLMALWREFGLDTFLHKAYQAGNVLAGISAGANCWFEDCSTDSLPGEFQVLACLGFLKGSFCPHYDGEAERRPSYQRLIGQGALKGGLAADDGAAVHFIDEELIRVVSSRPDARAYRVIRINDQVREEALGTEFLAEKK